MDEHLRQTVGLIEELSPGSKYLFSTNTRPGTRICANSKCDIRFSDSAITNAMRALKRKLIKAGFAPFQFKDIRKKYGTDIEAQGGDAQKSLMHTSRSTTNRHYTSKPTVLEPVR